MRKPLVAIWAGLGAFALFAPHLVDTFWVGLIMHILVFGLMALAVDLLIGHVGIFPLGHAAFFAVAAYTTAIMEARHAQPTLVASLAGIASALILATVFGLSVRTKGVYFILVTLAMGYIVWGVATRWTSFTGGDNGVGNIPLPKLGSLVVSGLHSYYYVVLAVVTGSVLGYRVLVRSPFGLTLRGIRESESRMRSLGYNVGVHKYAAFLISSGLVGIAGVLYVYMNRFVSPATAEFHLSAEVALMAIVGGSGTILGPFLGSLIILGIRNYVSAFIMEWATVMGVVFILTVLYAPKGLLGLMTSLNRPTNPSQDKENPPPELGKREA